MKLKFIQFFVVILFFISCKQNKKLDDVLIVKEKKIKTYDLIKQKELLPTNSIVYNFDLYLINNDEIFYPEEGLLAYEKNEDIGNISIYFVSKSGASIWEKKMDSLTEEGVNKELNRIKNLPLKDFKKEFNIYAFLIDKKYLQKTPEGMYQKEFFVREFYKYNTNNDSWFKIDSFIVNTKKLWNEERKWYKEKLEEIIKK